MTRCDAGLRQQFCRILFFIFHLVIISLESGSGMLMSYERRNEGCLMDRL